jgi:Domain of unknown function (DUF4392)
VPVVRRDPIDDVLALDLGGRGIAGFFLTGAALAAARTLARSRRALIVTGFCVPPGVPETDGPPGAAVLGHALEQLGATVRYVTDPAVVPPLRAALETLHASTEIETYPERADAHALLTRERPTHLVAIERPGRARSGEYLSARGESVAAWNRPLDELFLVASKRAAKTGRTPVTIAVGDGGNEIGMGNVRARLCRQGRLMARIASVVRVDHLVVAGTSNWGAYGIVAGLERLTGRALLHTPDQERRLIEACVEAGAVDGIVRSPKPTVDGLPLDVQAAIVELLRLAAASRQERRAMTGLEAGSSMMETR